MIGSSGHPLGIQGACLVEAAEPDEGIRFREATVQIFTGGELIRRMRREFVEIELDFELRVRNPAAGGGEK